jgi:antitoxin MazE
VDGFQPENVDTCVYTGGREWGDVVTQSDSQGRDGVPHRRFHQAVRRWGNSLALRLPAACLRQAGLREGDQVEIVVGDDGRLSLEPMHQLDRSALAMDLRRLQATMPLTPSVMEECRAAERW